jgi:hypothetical protein
MLKIDCNRAEIVPSTKSMAWMMGVQIAMYPDLIWGLPSILFICGGEGPLHPVPR